MEGKELDYKIADTPLEFQLIHQLNYKTFVEEIPQHKSNSERILVDRFHQENTYLIAKNGSILAGMMAVRGNRPFSLESKVPDLESYLPKGKRICEIRLLAVEKEYRKTQVFYGLAKQMVTFCLNAGFDLCIISGTTRQTKLYQHIGFRPFYHTVGTEGALYQPMYLEVGLIPENLRTIASE